jgi:hypothetical protein
MATLREIIVQALLIALLLGSVAGVAVGIALVSSAQSTLAFFRRMNRWVTSRIDQKAREEHPVAGHAALTSAQRRVAGAVFVLGGAFAASMLALTPKIAAATVLQARGALWAASLMLADVMRWILVVGCTGSVIVGILLLFFPQAWARLEARANHWHSTRQFFARTDVMHTPLDRWIEQSPRPAGVLITILSLVGVTAFAVLLLWHK